MSMMDIIEKLKAGELAGWALVLLIILFSTSWQKCDLCFRYKENEPVNLLH